MITTVATSFYKINIPDQDYYGIWNNGEVVIPFIDEDFIFSVDVPSPFMDINVCVHIKDGEAVCSPRKI